METIGIDRNITGSGELQGPPAPPSAPDLPGGPDAREVRLSKLHQAAEHFESLFVQTLMKTMRQTVPTSELTGGGEMDTYKQMLDEAMADRIGGSGGLGIAEMVTRQYEPYVNGDGAPDTRDGPGMAPIPDDRTGGALPVDTFAPLPATSRLGPEIDRALAAYADADRRAPRRDTSGLTERAHALGGAAADTLRRWGPEIEAAARDHDLAPELVLAVMVQESGGRPDAVSRAGAQGLMQLMPGTAAEMGVDDPFDPVQNIRGGVRYLARMREQFGGDLDLVLAAYNAGPGNVRRAGDVVPDFAETRTYVQKVGAMYGDLDGNPSLGFAP